MSVLYEKGSLFVQESVSNRSKLLTARPSRAPLQVSRADARPRIKPKEAQLPSSVVVTGPTRLGDFSSGAEERRKKSPQPKRDYATYLITLGGRPPELGSTSRLKPSTPRTCSSKSSISAADRRPLHDLVIADLSTPSGPA